MNMMKPKEQMNINGTTWKLHKSATDASIPFALNRVVVEDATCINVAEGSFMVLLVGRIMPMPNSIEQPVRVLMIGFANRQVGPHEIGEAQLNSMHVYKTDMGNMAEETARAFFGSESEELKSDVVITGYPQHATSEEKENKDD